MLSSYIVFQLCVHSVCNAHHVPVYIFKAAAHRYILKKGNCVTNIFQVNIPDPFSTIVIRREMKISDSICICNLFCQLDLRAQVRMMSTKSNVASIVANRPGMPWTVQGFDRF